MSKHLVFMIIIFWREEETLRTRTSYEVLVHFICELFLFIARMELAPDYLERRSFVTWRGPRSVFFPKNDDMNLILHFSSADLRNDAFLILACG
jgi:hypothetical protein